MSIIRKVSERTGVPIEIVERIEHDLWKEVKRYTYQPHMMRGGIILGKVLKLRVRYKMVKRLSYQYASSEYPRFRSLAAYYARLAEIIEDALYRGKRAVTPKKLEKLYQQKFNNNGNQERNETFEGGPLAGLHRQQEGKEE